MTDPIDYAQALGMARPGEEWSLTGNDLSTLVWFSDTPAPTAEELDAAWASAAG